MLLGGSGGSDARELAHRGVLLADLRRPGAPRDDGRLGGRAPRRRRSPTRRAPRRPGGRRRRPRTRRASGRGTSSPSTDGAIARTAADCAPPPMRNSRSTGDALGAQRVDAVGERAEHALDRGAGQVRGRRVGQAQAVQGAGGVGLVRGALALQVGHEDEPVGARGCGQGQRGQARRGRRRASGRRRRARARRSGCRRAAGSAPVASAKPVTRPEPSAVGRRRDRRDDARRCRWRRRRRRAAGPAPRAAAALSPAPGPRIGAAGGPGAGLGRAEHARDERVVPEGQLEQVVPVVLGGGRPVAGAGGVRAVGDQGVEARSRRRGARSASRGGGRRRRRARRSPARRRAASAAWSRSATRRARSRRRRPTPAVRRAPR